MTARDLQIILSEYQLRHPNETTLQFAIAQVFDQNKIGYEREVRLDQFDRPDFMVEAVAVEVKVDGPLAEVTRQIHRYSQHQAVQEILLVTTQAKHMAMPEQFNGKKITVCWIGGNSL